MTWPTDDDHDTHEDYERRLAQAEEEACNVEAHTLVPVPGWEGLAQCTVCRAAEGTLPTECPGRPMHYDEMEAVYDGLLDFRGGAWVRLKEGPLPSGCSGSGG